MKPRLLLVFSIAWFAYTLPLHALEFRLVSWEGEISDLKYSNGSAQVTISASESNLSDVYEFKGSPPLILYKEVQKEGKTVRQAVATLTPPDGFTKAIVLLAYTDASKTTYSGVWINDSVDARPPQTVTYHNFSSYPIAIKLDTKEYMIPPKGDYIQSTNAAMKRVLFKAAAQTKTGWEVVASTVQPVRPGLRTLVMMRDGRPDSYTGLTEVVDILKFNDYPPPPEPTTVASR
jgi:hypothetical protein